MCIRAGGDGRFPVGSTLITTSPHVTMCHPTPTPPNPMYAQNQMQSDVVIVSTNLRILEVCYNL